LLTAGFALFLTTSAIAQSSEADSRQTRTTLDSNGAPRLETDISTPPMGLERRPRIVGSGNSSKVSAVSSARPAPAPPLAGRFDRQLLTAIESHLGSSYQFNTTGPDTFDCSGFVWRAFQEAGFSFSRGPARSYWATFAPPSTEDQYKFGTLVFFSGLTHVGIVADEKGFYHSSRHHGVVYSPFDKYWLPRIDGFRRVPNESMSQPAWGAKSRAANKPAANTSRVEEGNAP